MINIPAYLQHDFDALSPEQQQKFMELANWGAAGYPGQAAVISDGSFQKILETVKRMGINPETPVEPDRTVNHDWDFQPKQREDQ